MSILIKGMEMPKNCFECPWRCKVDPENLLCRISGEYFEETFSGTIQNRHKSCPLVLVPKHGRLIAETDAVETTWMILEGLGYRRVENPQLEQTVCEVYATVSAIEVE